MSQSEPRHPSAEKLHSPICTSVSRLTQTPTSQSELPIVSVSPHYYQDKPHTVAAETSHDNAVKHDSIGVKRKASHDVTFTDCTLSIGDCVHIRVRTWTGKIQYIWSSM